MHLLQQSKQRLLPPKAPDVSPLTAFPAVQVVEPRVALATVPAGDVRQTLALPGHRAAGALLPRGPVGIAVAGYGGKTETAKEADHPRELLKCKPFK